MKIRYAIHHGSIYVDFYNVQSHTYEYHILYISAVTPYTNRYSLSFYYFNQYLNLDKQLYNIKLNVQDFGISNYKDINQYITSNLIDQVE